jgi:hypothetical protein
MRYSYQPSYSDNNNNNNNNTHQLYPAWFKIDDDAEWYNVTTLEQQ